MTTDTNSWEWREECLRRHKQRVEDLKRAATQKQRVAIFERIADAAGIDVARSAWVCAFPPKKPEGKK